MKLLLLPALDCNRQCAYCYLQAGKASLSLKSDIGRSPEDWMAGLDKIKNVNSIDISGGEPFMYPHFVKLLKMLIERYGVVSITSNLDLLPEEFFEISNDKIWITVSYHMDDGEENKSILLKMQRLRDAGYHFAINFVAAPGQILFYDKIIKIGRLFKVPTHLEPYIDYNREPEFFGIPNNLEEYEYMFCNIRKDEITAIEQANERGIDTPRTISCDVSTNYMVISENGNIYPCLGMMFKERNKLGNIFSDTRANLYKHPIECDIFCPCAQNYRDGFK